MAYASNPNASEVVAGGLGVQSHPQLHSGLWSNLGAVRLRLNKTFQSISNKQSQQYVQRRGI